MEHKTNYNIEDFQKIIKTLRSENGCPWDREQTHDTLKPCMTEEAAELLASIRIYNKTGNAENMKEELGDILLQVMMHSQIADEEGLFTFEDVIQEISEKMIRRHPHVFGNIIAEDTADVLENWEEIKKREKEEKNWIESPLREIPQELPALARAIKVIKKMDKIYKNSKTYEQATADLLRSAAILKEKKTGELVEIQQLIGEILFDVSVISQNKKIQQEQLLQDFIEDMIENQEKS